MPHIFDNIDTILLPEFQQEFKTALRADICVGYFNLRGWKHLHPAIAHLEGTEDSRVRLLIGMQRLPIEDVRALYSATDADGSIDLPTATRLKTEIVAGFRDQLILGAPTNEDERALRDLADDLRSGRLVVKLFLRFPLHAKLYLVHRPDRKAAAVGYLGSSNLTFSGLTGQGELNIDVVDNDAVDKLCDWFKNRWEDRFCLDITQELLAVLGESWAREDLIPPYEIYLKMAYHLSQDAREGISGSWRLPAPFDKLLFPYQGAAVLIAANHLNKRGGVLLGDVVGLGKTFMAAAVAKIFQEDQSSNALILCPPNLVPMWENVVQTYGLIGKVMSIGGVDKNLAEQIRYRVVIIDESHNLRNREGKRYAAIRDYIAQNESKVILLSATPYNKAYLDLSSQFRLFLAPEGDLGIRPETLLRELGGETAFTAKFQVPARSLAAFERSEHTDDWRELMRLFMVRRTRSFIINHYAERDADSGRPYLTKADGTRSYFPERVPKTVKLPDDPQYSRLYSDFVVDHIGHLELPRYGLGQYVDKLQRNKASPAEDKQLENLGKAGVRLIGFSRTNLFKRLESSGESFLRSIVRHIVRNLVYLYALDNGLPFPIGTLDAGALDPDLADEDTDGLRSLLEDGADIEDDPVDVLARHAQALYGDLSTTYRNRFEWIDSTFFTPKLRTDLEADNVRLTAIQQHAGEWDVSADQKLAAMIDLVQQRHPNRKVLVFSQFADTIRYLHRGLRDAGVSHVERVTGSSGDVTSIAHRFSPVSNSAGWVTPDHEIRVLLTTDVLSEGQNLQDCAIVVNYDLPWAIIRLAQRAGRVDRIGQVADTVLAYSFLPHDGVEQLIRLRARVQQRLLANAEVVGSDERYFEGDTASQKVRDLYTEKSGILDDDEMDDVDLGSFALQIWQDAIKNNKALADRVSAMPNVVYSAREYTGTAENPAGALVYVKSGDGTDSLAWVDQHGTPVTQSHWAILRAAECKPNTPAIERAENHHDIVRAAVEHIASELRENGTAGALGGPGSVRRRLYERVSQILEKERKKRTLWITPEQFEALQAIHNAVYHYPLTETANRGLGRQMRTSIDDDDLTRAAIQYYDDGNLVVIHGDDERDTEPVVVCSLGLHSG